MEKVKDGVKGELFRKLYNLDVTPLVKEYMTKNGGLSYLSWANAWQLLKHQDESATFEVCVSSDGFPLFSRGQIHFVKTNVRAFGRSECCWLPVMDNRHNAIPNPNARQINDSIMRCLAKNVALYGIGLKLYTGEDLKQYSDIPDVKDGITGDMLEEIEKLSKNKKVSLPEIDIYCKNTFKVPLNQTTKTQGIAVIELLKKTPTPKEEK